MILDKWDYRINDIVEAGIEFTKETELNIVDDNFNEAVYRDKVLQDLYLLFNSGQCALLASYEQDTLAGFAIVTVDNLFVLNPIGIVDKFYVRPAYRKTKHARALAEEVTKWFDSKGVKESFVTSTAGVGQGKQFENLFNKFGYSVMGSSMRRTHV